MIGIRYDIPELVDRQRGTIISHIEEFCREHLVEFVQTCPNAGTIVAELVTVSADEKMEKAKEKLRQELQEDVESVEEAQRPEELARSYEARKREEAEIKARFWRDANS